jgi:hypothetical protein
MYKGPATCTCHVSLTAGSTRQYRDLLRVSVEVVVFLKSQGKVVAFSNHNRNYDDVLFFS